MVDVEETRLPGVGTKFTIQTARDEKICSVVHLDGLREIYAYENEDEEPHVIVLNDEEARQLGAILGGVVYRPQLVEDLELAIKDLFIEWIEVPANSPIVGLTVATCRIRSTTGATIVAILRDSGALAMPHPDEVLRAGDVMVVIARPDTVPAIRKLIETGPPA
ncbi:MAG: potassium transporter [Thermoleophilia bacterium]|nr:potassium transporter [Thermoleophilia bacterium]MDH3724506.1 potassium transporter [Thermoleophilia bacterium]